MTILCLLCAIAAFALFGLASGQHYQQRLGVRPSPERKRMLKCLAWAGVVLCFVLAFAAQGAVYGGVLWLGALSFGAAAVFLFLNLTPTEADRSRRSK